jgi:putative NADH-flavin reductase
VRVALFGATGSIGSLVLDQLLEQGHGVKVLVGDPAKVPSRSERLTVIKGDSGDPGAVGQVIEGCDAVIYTLGVRANSSAEVKRLLAVTELVLTTMRKSGARRFIGVAGAGVKVPWDEKGVGYGLAAWFSKLTFRRGVEEKQKEFELVSKSGLDWTIVRVPYITEGTLTKNYRADLKRPPSSRISRADIAYAVVMQLKERRYVKAAPFVGA